MLSPLIPERRFRYLPANPSNVHFWRASCGVRVLMEIGETLYVTTARDFRRWLQQNHARKSEIWLVRYKKATGKASIDYVEALEEALCFGWIDSTEKSMDSERYALRFSPRRPRSNWNEANRERALRLIVSGRMTAAGARVLPPQLQPSAGSSRKASRSREARRHA